MSPLTFVAFVLGILVGACLTAMVYELGARCARKGKQ